jgi:hypothetical protein
MKKKMRKMTGRDFERPLRKGWFFYLPKDHPGSPEPGECCLALIGITPWRPKTIPRWALNQDGKNNLKKI